MIRAWLLKQLRAVPLETSQTEIDRLVNRLTEEKRRGASLMNRLIDTERRLQSAHHENSRNSFMALADQVTILALRCRNQEKDHLA